MKSWLDSNFVKAILIFLAVASVFIGAIGVFPHVPLSIVTICILSATTLTLLITQLFQEKRLSSLHDELIGLNDSRIKKWRTLVENKKYKDLRDLFRLIDQVKEELSGKRNKTKKREIITQGLQKVSEKLSVFLSESPDGKDLSVNISVFVQSFNGSELCALKVMEYPRFSAPYGPYYPLGANTDFDVAESNLFLKKDSSFMCNNIDTYPSFENTIYNKEGKHAKQVPPDFKSILNCVIYDVFVQQAYKKSFSTEDCDEQEKPYPLDGYLVCDSDKFDVFDDSDKVLVKLIASQLQPILIKF